MSSPDDLELVSRLLAGELSPGEATEVQARLLREPQLRQALAAMEQLLEDAAQLPDTLSDERANALVQRALSSPRRPRAATFVALAMVALALIASVLVLRAPTRASLVALAGEVSVSGRPLEVGRAVRLGSDERLEAGEQGALLSLWGEQVLLLPRNSSVRATPAGLELLAGALLLSGASSLEVRAGADLVQVQGQAVLMMEPPDEVLRVTRALTSPHTENTLKTSWMMLGPATVGAAVGVGLTLLVVHGEATVRSPEAAPVRVGAGERWSQGEARGTPLQAGAATGSPAQAPSAATATEAKELSLLSRGQLIERVEALRDEKEQLLREQAQLKQKLAAAPHEAPRTASYGRLTPEELSEHAKKGQVRFRLNLQGSELKVEKELSERVGLTAEEEAALKQLSAQSFARLHAGLVAAYAQIGGDPNLGQTFTTMTLLEELKSKSLKEDYAAAIRQVANERAGLVPPGGPASANALLRAYRLLWTEDDRLVAEVEALLGPARAERYLNDKDAEHSDHTWGVGPEKK